MIDNILLFFVVILVTNSLSTNQTINLYCLHRLSLDNWCHRYSLTKRAINSDCIGFQKSLNISTDNHKTSSLPVDNQFCQIRHIIPEISKFLYYEIHINIIDFTTEADNCSIKIDFIRNGNESRNFFQFLGGNNRSYNQKHIVKLHEYVELKWKMNASCIKTVNVFFYIKLFTSNKNRSYYSCSREPMNNLDYYESINRLLVCDNNIQCSNGADENPILCNDKLKRRSFDSKERWTIYFNIVINSIALILCCTFVNVTSHYINLQIFNELSSDFLIPTGQSHGSLSSIDNLLDHNYPPPIYNLAFDKNYKKKDNDINKKNDVPLNMNPPKYADIDGHIGVVPKFYDKFTINKKYNSKKTIRSWLRSGKIKTTFPLPSSSTLNEFDNDELNDSQ